MLSEPAIAQMVTRLQVSAAAYGLRDSAGSAWPATWLGAADGHDQQQELVYLADRAARRSYRRLPKTAQHEETPP